MCPRCRHSDGIQSRKHFTGIPSANDAVGVDVLKAPIKAEPLIEGTCKERGDSRDSEGVGDEVAIVAEVEDNVID